MFTNRNGMVGWAGALTWVAVLWGAAAVAFPAAAAVGATKTFDLHFRVHCEPPSNPGGDLCFDKSGWSSVGDIRADYRRTVMPVLNQVFRPARISFRLDEVTYNDKNFFFNAVTAASNDHASCPNSINEQAVEAMRKLAAEPANRDRITVFALPNLCQGWSAIPPADDSSEHYALFVSPLIHLDPFFLAHEMSHHFCLAHTHTLKDAQPGSSCGTADHDGDGLIDTPPDPAPVEPVKGSDWKKALWLEAFGDDSLVKKYKTDADLIVTDADSALGPHPNYANTTPFACHEWCDWVELPATSPLDGALSQIGKKTRACFPLCYRATAEPAPTSSHIPLQTPPDTANVVSYYFRSCSGPVVFAGNPRPALVKGQVEKISACIKDIAERDAYADACAARGGDTDLDGICDFDDGCPTVFNADGFDTDGDGTPDACDLCPLTFEPAQLDTDGDGLGDLCDGNDDNDACPDAVDQHPKDSMVVVGTRVNSGCDPEKSPFLVSESGDTDGDGILDCQDTDDDDDGLPDDGDPCPLVKGAEGCEYAGVACPPSTRWLKLCQGPGCGPLLDLVIISSVNPAEEIVFHDFQIRGHRIYVSPRPGVMVRETLGRLLGAPFSPGPDGAAPALSLAIRSREGDRLIPVLDSFRAAELNVSWDAPGQVLMLDFADPSGVAVSRTWGAGLDPLERLADTDGDGLPDVADNCTARSNPDQIDADGDGFGNSCDLDLDNDGIVTAAEVAFVEDCESVRLRPAIHLYEDGEGRDSGSDSFAGLLRQAHCAPADLDDSGRVDAADVSEAASRLGLQPGPSGLVAAPTLRDEPKPEILVWLWALLILLALMLLIHRLRRSARAPA